MAKIYGINGVITGKLGAAVYAVRNGEQISRQYQPVVANPQTTGQVAARAKLKLLSQVSAVMAPVIAIPRRGAVSSRNLFVKVNYPLSSFNDNNAEIELEEIQLTKSVVGLPSLYLNRTDPNTLRMVLNTNAGDISRVVYCIFNIDDDKKLHFIKSVVANNAGEGRDFGVNTEIIGTLDYLILAYGVRDNTEAARVAFGNLKVITATAIANLITSRTLLETDVTLTETRGGMSLHPSA